VPFSPEEIEGRSFVVALRGYDREEVDAFLRAVADEQRDLVSRLDQLRAELEDVRAGAPDAVARQALWVTTLLAAAARDAERIRRDADRSAGNLLALARRTADATLVRAVWARRQMLEADHDGVTMEEDAEQAVRQMVRGWQASRRSTYREALSALDGLRASLDAQLGRLDELDEALAAAPAEADDAASG
jgi:DivIVA domain-containing protein